MRLQACFLLFIISFQSSAQITFNKGKRDSLFSLSATKAKEAIKLDGVLSEAVWATAGTAHDFWEHWPDDKNSAKKATEVRITYDDIFLYIAAICFDNETALPFTIQTLKRDQHFFDSDGFAVVLDPLGQATNGFMFGVSPYNVQSEGLIANNATLDYSWDNKWFSATKRYEDRWVSEIAIPFKTVRYSQPKNNWSINFIRNDVKSNEIHTWASVPVNFQPVDLGYTGNVYFTDSLPGNNKNLTLIPYVTESIKQNKSIGNHVNSIFNAGFDAKVALSSSLNLDLTVNPEFSQVEVDKQVTNLTRFNIFFPEKRNFFLENDDLFSGYLSPELRPFYSRSIGLDHDGNRIPIIAGVRLTGNIDKKTRLGILNIQTAEQQNFAAQNYTAANFQRRVLKRSYVKAYFLNRQGFLNTEQKQANPLDAYGRNSGVETVYSNARGSIVGWFGYHLSWKPGLRDDNFIKNTGLQFTGRKLNGFIDLNLVGSNYYADMGFVQRIQNFDALEDTVIRLGFNQINGELNYNIYPKKGRINQHLLGFENLLVYNTGGGLNERFNRLRYLMNFKNTSNLNFRIENTDVHLLFSTSLTDGYPLPPARYIYNQYNVRYESDSRKKIVYSGSFRIGKLYSGDFEQYIASLSYRVQPWGNFRVDVERDVLEFKYPFGNAKLVLVSPRVEINFSNNFFWTTFLQYNTQRNNFNVYSRLQWRYKPMSDLFLVYTDNYYADPFLKNKNKAIVFKANYWLNL